MASISRPVSLIQPSVSPRPTTSSSVDHLSPLRRSLSPPGKAHYTLRRFSYLSEFPSEEDLVPVRASRSIFRSASFSSMGFGFKEKSKETEISRPRKKSDHVKSLSPPSGRPCSPMSFVPPPTIRFNDRPTSSHGLFSLHKPKGLKKKRSLASLLTAASESVATEALHAPPRPVRALSSDGASQSHLVVPSIASLSATKDRAARAAEQDLRKEEYRQLQLKAPRPKLSRANSRKTVWTKRYNMKVHTFRSQAAYMQAYDPILLENDRHLNILLRRLNPLENPSFRDYGRKVPFFVLDVGCGAGYWLLEAANCWVQSSITGFDMVDVLIPEVRNNDRITFSRGNFLRGPWPFPEKTFDLVRMANLSLCIPYDKWEMVLAEVHRVLTVDGRLELIDDQIFFPYAPPPAPRPVSISFSTPKPPVLTRGISFFEMGDEREMVGDDNDDADSLRTESTFIGDEDTSSSSHEHRTRLSTSGPDAHRNSLERPLSPSRALEDSKTPTSAATIKPRDTAQPSEWALDAAASRDMETVFQNMLHKKYGIHSRPSEFIVDIMQHVFGNGEKLKTYHLKLAPKDAHLDFESIGGSGSFEGSEKDEKSGLDSKGVGQRINEITRPWFNADFDKEEKKRLKRHNKASTPTTEAALSPDTRIPEGLSAKAAGRLGIREDIPKVILRMPENVSAKAALRLGIPMSGECERKSEESSRSPSPSLASDSGSETSNISCPNPSPPSPAISSAAPPIAERNSQDFANESRLSAKAAHRLGISYSALTEAAASAKASIRRPQSSSSTLVSNPSGPIQSPGLIVWPSKFIPLSPTELEMHACKNVHTLIGCKPALADFIGSFYNQDGTRMESDEGLDQALWDYECFRRRRFSWPSEILEWDTTDPDADAVNPAPIPRSGDTPKSATFRNSMMISDMPPDTAEPPPSHHYKSDDLTHVRTLRVYEAIKTGEYSLSTLRFPRSPPPSPLR
ncbi:hypothetical protein D9615_001123 [Tricholomella constricta]|uniref:Methyltransferase domain-containing protein n=1 Tax=Tricholomella constricta TaxID=117010 RepID=A0A8H5HKC0_9AGAR|nr:hypothetical protein D9615_001123 [Tricholomella constricta]